MGDDWFAVDLQVVREIVPSPMVTPVPTAPPALLGLFNLRGQLVPLFDIAGLVGLPPVGGREYATVVDAAPELGRHGLAGLGSSGPPEIGELRASTGPSVLPGSRGIFTVPVEFAPNRAVVLLDVEELLRPS